MASRQGSGEAAVGVVVLLGQIFMLELEIAAASPELARQLAARCAAYDRSGLAQWCFFAVMQCFLGNSRCWSSTTDLPRARTLGGRGYSFGFAAR